ncbi:MAG: hypothetical protein HRT45_17455 [Bdellovibrionales bacterium]|nr:hypothetical protein [Bdellovibrionales bacterium]
MNNLSRHQSRSFNDWSSRAMKRVDFNKHESKGQSQDSVSEELRLLSTLTLGLICCLILTLVACKNDRDKRNRIGGLGDLAPVGAEQTPAQSSTGSGNDSHLSGHIGGADTGGGNGFSSTPEQVLETLQKVKRRTLPVALYRVSRLMEPISEPEMQQPQELLGSEIRQIFEGILNGNYANPNPMYQDVLDAQWRLVTDGPCYDRAGIAHDASAQENGVVCFSLPRLVSIPSHILEKELTAVAAHEHVHRYDLWEEGLVVQEFFLRTGDLFREFRNFVNPDTATLRQMILEINRVVIATNALDNLLKIDGAIISDSIDKVNDQNVEDLKTNDEPIAEAEENSALLKGRMSKIRPEDVPDTMICSHVGRLSGLISNLFGGGDGDEYGANGEGVMMHPNYWSLAGRLSQRVASAFTFCGFSVKSGYGLKAEQLHLDGPYYFRLEKGDRDSLAELTLEISNDAQLFYQDTRDYLYGVVPGLDKEDLDITGTISIENSEGVAVELPATVLESE